MTSQASYLRVQFHILITSCTSILEQGARATTTFYLNFKNYGLGLNSNLSYAMKRIKYREKQQKQNFFNSSTLLNSNLENRLKNKLQLYLAYYVELTQNLDEALVPQWTL